MHLTRHTPPELLHGSTLGWLLSSISPSLKAYIDRGEQAYATEPTGVHVQDMGDRSTDDEQASMIIHPFLEDTFSRRPLMFPRAGELQARTPWMMP